MFGNEEDYASKMEAAPTICEQPGDGSEGTLWSARIRSMDGNMANINPTKDVDRPPFLRLPGEIQNRIYELAVVSDEPITIDIRRDPDGGRELGVNRHGTTHSSLIRPSEPALAMVCKSIRDDVRAIYYHLNTFDLQADYIRYEDQGVAVAKLDAWITQIGKHAKHLRRLRLHIWQYIVLSNGFATVRLEADMMLDGTIVLQPYIKSKKGGFEKSCRHEIEHLATAFSAQDSDGGRLLTIIRHVLSAARIDRISCCQICGLLRPQNEAVGIGVGLPVY